MDPITASALVFAVINLSVLINAHGRKVWVPRIGDWDETPPILVSNTGTCTLEEVSTAAQYWRDLGHELGPVALTDAEEGPVEGAIFIGRPTKDWREGAGGRATWRTSWPRTQEEDKAKEHSPHNSKAEDVVALRSVGSIKEAVIEISPALSGSYKMKALIHEFGHALGYLHTETALLGRRKKDKKNGKRKAGDARRFLGIKLVARKSGHIMHPLLSEIGDPYKKGNQKGLREDEDED